MKGTSKNSPGRNSNFNICRQGLASRGPLGKDPNALGAPRYPDLGLLDAVILQAATPYDSVLNPLSAAFFADYEIFARAKFSELVIKHNPNRNRVRPTESRTIYFDDVPRALRT